MRNILLKIQYDGSRYKGFQRLKEEMTIQSKIEAVLSKMTDGEILICASGRTDMGVHAYGQVANFKTNSNMSTTKMKKYLKEYLPEDIVVFEVREVDERFHSRYNAKSKTYLYKIDNNTFQSPFYRKYATYIASKLDVELMKEASEAFLGEHDFTAFCSAKSKKKSNVRKIYSINIKEENGFINIYIDGNGFLYNMVRIMVSALIDAGMGKINKSDIEKMLESKERKCETASAKGLYLYRVMY
jgi:tRNA pseudouridine38-40 synthase